MLALLFPALFLVLLGIGAQDATGELRNDRVMVTVAGAFFLGAVVGLLVGAFVFAIRKSRYIGRCHRYAARLQAVYPQPPQ